MLINSNVVGAQVPDFLSFSPVTDLNQSSESGTF